MVQAAQLNVDVSLINGSDNCHHYSRAPVSTDLVSAVSVIHSLHRPKNEFEN
jgi:hypothetical protein